MRWARALALVAACAAPGPAVGAAASGDWPTFGHDAARSGTNPAESAISASTAPGLRLLWTAKLPARADSTPVLLSGIGTPGGTRDVLILSTLEGGLVGLDAAKGSILWSATTSGDSKLTNSSPVVDASRRWVYAYGLDGRLHRYRPDTGADEKGGGWPVLVTRMPRTEKESSALNAANGRVYVTTSGYLGDAMPYQGHVVTIDAPTGDSRVLNSLCSDVARLLAAGDCTAQRSGIWARAGAVVDPASDRIFVATGNGPFDGERNWGDSVLALSGDGSRLLDSYTPSSHADLDREDADLGSTAPALLPPVPGSRIARLAVQGGKDRVLRLLNRDDLSGRGGPGHVGGELQSVPTPGECAVLTQPAVWTDPQGGAVWLLVSDSCATSGYEVTASGDGSPRLREAWTVQRGATSPVVAGGVLFAARDHELFALDPRTGRELWTSRGEGAGGTIGSIHWESPIVAGGRVFVADQEGRVLAYGLGR